MMRRLYAVFTAWAGVASQWRRSALWARL